MHTHLSHRSRHVEPAPFEMISRKNGAHPKLKAISENIVKSDQDVVIYAPFLSDVVCAFILGKDGQCEGYAPIFARWHVGNLRRSRRLFNGHDFAEGRCVGFSISTGHDDIHRWRLTEVFKLHNDNGSLSNLPIIDPDPQFADICSKLCASVFSIGRQAILRLLKRLAGQRDCGEKAHCPQHADEDLKDREIQHSSCGIRHLLLCCEIFGGAANFFQLLTALHYRQSHRIGAYALSGVELSRDKLGRLCRWVGRSKPHDQWEAKQKHDSSNHIWPLSQIAAVVQ